MSHTKLAISLIAAFALTTAGCAKSPEPVPEPAPAPAASTTPAKGKSAPAKTAPAKAAPAEEAAPASASASIPKGHPFAKITEGMYDQDVVKILGQPTNRHEYPTGKSAIPFYHGTDMWRSDWSYKGKGHVVFSRNQYTGSYTVIEVLYDPSTP